MIALAILGLGLLVIGAALPVGLRYTRESVNIATGQAAAEHALDLIAQNVCLPRTILTGGVPAREPGLFQPRDSAISTAPFDPTYEPVIKVHPLFVRSINATPGSGTFGEERDPSLGASVEQAIYNFLPILSVVPDTKECDSNAWMRAALPSVAQAYPAITPDVPFSQLEFFNNKYAPRPVAGPSANGAESRKVLDSLISWTAFYRRVSYDDPNTPTVNESDPTLYEFIAVAARRPSLRHRFPVQNPADGSFWGADTPVPVPWLLTFTGLPTPAGGGFDPVTAFPYMLGQNPATVIFNCDPSVSGLFPVGSIFIPARNDVHPSTAMLTPVDYVSFGPPAPNTLPIYEVVQRPNDTTVVVKYNGYYPRQGTSIPTIPSYWPVWVIPPAYEEGPSTNPVLPDRSPIVAVARRYIRLREITP